MYYEIETYKFLEFLDLKTESGSRYIRMSFSSIVNKNFSKFMPRSRWNLQRLEGRQFRRLIAKPYQNKMIEKTLLKPIPYKIKLNDVFDYARVKQYQKAEMGKKNHLLKRHYPMNSAVSLPYRREVPQRSGPIVQKISHRKEPPLIGR